MYKYDSSEPLCLSPFHLPPTLLGHPFFGVLPDRTSFHLNRIKPDQRQEDCQPAVCHCSSPLPPFAPWCVEATMEDHIGETSAVAIILLFVSFGTVILVTFLDCFEALAFISKHGIQELKVIEKY
ncbi:uncharacterized protein BYT42DRAFT_548571 [Radiomyces spectabilis]|uniref:uncharacterized protein n=1 Tax=Radiomyces spectabilis TaxID=64574 RepID=UPI00221EAE38|nr:uncharacterized protein BYT42DRAFT_548571 [Radiomyces spectabilis]KAI8371758.1 hypothetical protein BYT42DRAFT_548571 [Radiomyces spectabilis]